MYARRTYRYMLCVESLHRRSCMMHSVTQCVTIRLSQQCSAPESVPTRLPLLHPDRRWRIGLSSTRPDIAELEPCGCRLRRRIEVGSSQALRTKGRGRGLWMIISTREIWDTGSSLLTANRSASAAHRSIVRLVDRRPLSPARAS